MAWHEFAVVEHLHACKVAYYASRYPADDVTKGVDIGPLYDLFFESARRTYARETGEESTPDALNHWMGPTRFHLPPTIRWICHMDLVDGAPNRDSLEVWMAYSSRVALGAYDRIKVWRGGWYAAVESTFETTVTESWEHLQRLLRYHDLRPTGDCALVENLQATSHGGWDRYRVLVHIDERPLLYRGWVI